MFNNFSSEDLKNMATIINFMKENGMDIDSLSSMTKRDNTKTNENDVKKKMKDFEDVAFDAEWEKVLEYREKYPERRFLKEQGKKATEEDLNNILKKLNNGKIMSDEDIDRLLGE